jgi:hypothetical protein
LDEDALEKTTSLQDIDLGGSFSEMTESKSLSEYIPLAWMYLLVRLTDLIPDAKHEVRNGAVHTALRIFDNHGDDFSPSVWQLLFERIFLRMVGLDIKKYKELCHSVEDTFGEQESDVIKSKIGTSKILLADSSKLIADYLEPISKAQKFKQLWSLLMASFAQYLSFHLHELTGSVFMALNVIMTKAGQSKSLDASSIEKASAVWGQNFPRAESKLLVGTNLEAYEPYITSLKSIYQFRKHQVTTEETEQIVRNLERVVQESESPSYSSDLDSMTELHSRVIACAQELRTDMPGATSVVLGMLARFIGMPLMVPEQVPGQRGTLTYMALSKASMDLAQKLTIGDAPWEELLHSESMQLLLVNLEHSIQLKYNRTRQGRTPPLWKKATTTAIVLLERALPKMLDYKLPTAALRSYWDTTVGIGHNICHADIPSPGHEGPSVVSHASPVSIAEDEAFDIDALTRLNALLVPSLGHESIPDSTRRRHARSLFTASLIHHTPPKFSAADDQINGFENGDSEIPGRLDAEPLADLYTIRPGRTYDVLPRAREQMGYTCFRALLDLLRSRAAVNTSSATIDDEKTEQHVRLARAAAPYVILRAALPLKTYAADQPLRGKMPMPIGQVKELVTILKELGELRCEKKAIPATEGVQSSEGGQLVRLYPLVVKAAGVSTRGSTEKEVTVALQSWLGRLGGELGVGA